MHAMLRPKHLQSPKYRLEKTIPLGQHHYLFDMTCSGQGILAVSDAFYHSIDKQQIFFNSPAGLYIAHQNEGTNKPKFIFGTDDSVFQYDCEYRTYSKIWPSTITVDEQVRTLTTATKFSSTTDYSPQGILVRKCGDILICLWNNEKGERSLGKVVSAKGEFRIFMDKNIPLLICPTYIAENGNGDICVSDVKAVVVTDAGGMLRFRYQGNTTGSTLDPYGICCDSWCNIIVAYMKSDLIHVLNKEGKFLNFLTHERFRMPRALCIDENGQVYVGEWNSDAIKVISP